MNTLIKWNPIHENLIVGIYDDGDSYKTIGKFKLYTMSDDTFGIGAMKRTTESKHPGIRPRFGIVLALSKKAAESGVKLKDKVLMDTMTWHRGLEVEHGDNKIRVNRISVKDILCIDDDGFDEVEKEYINQKFPGIL